MHDGRPLWRDATYVLPRAILTFTAVAVAAFFVSKVIDPATRDTAVLVGGLLFGLAWAAAIGWAVAELSGGRPRDRS